MNQLQAGPHIFHSVPEYELDHLHVRTLRYDPLIAKQVHKNWNGLENLLKYEAILFLSIQCNMNATGGE